MNVCFQAHLDGKKSPKPYDGVCCQACWEAKEEKCTCKCGGLYHGLGRGESDLMYEDKILPEEYAKQFRKHITDFQCRWCCADLEPEPIMYYEPHDGGWEIEGFKDLVWLFVKCPNCGYDWSLWKLGVPRDAKAIKQK